MRRDSRRLGTSCTAMTAPQNHGVVQGCSNPKDQKTAVSDTTKHSRVVEPECVGEVALVNVKLFH
jgi:hypothetical protein